ncbi:MAG: RluA family pseudouridine synthase [Candidatus Latescibacterota bacterium]
MLEFLVLEDEAGRRVDQFLAEQELGCSRSYLQKLIGAGHVIINGVQPKSSYAIRPGDRVFVTLPEPIPTHLDPEEIPLDIFLEDEHLLVLNKPAGMVVHPSSGHRTGTLVHALLHHCKHLSGIGGVLKPGIVHRLDRDTSGLLVVAKDDETHRELSRQFGERTIARTYLALVWGTPEPPEGRIEKPIGRSSSDRKKMAVTEKGRGRFAATRYRVTDEFDFLSCLSLGLETGRTHQIRVHMSHIGHPVFGDPIYSGREKQLKGIAPDYRIQARSFLAQMPRQALHAATLGFVHPKTGEPREFSAEMPEDMKSLLDVVGGA